VLSPDFYFLSGREIVIVSSLSLEFLPIWLAEYAVCGLIVSNYEIRLSQSPSTRDFVASGRRFATPCASLRDAWLASLVNRGRLGASLL